MPLVPLRRIPKNIFFALGLGLLLFLLHTFRVVDFHEWDGIDLRFQLRGPQKASSEIVIVAIDDQSLSSLGQWPWPRTIHAQFLNILSRVKPKAVFFDILFTETASHPEEDEKFREAIRQAGSVLLPFFYASEKPFLPQFPIPQLHEVSAATAFVNTWREQDGRARRVKAQLKTNQGIFYSPALALMKMAREREPLRDVPLQGDFLWINFPGGLESFQAVSLQEVVMRAAREENEFLQNLFAGKIVLIGHTATGTTDIQATPFSTSTPGVVVHASTLHTLLSRKFLQILPAWLHLVLLLILCPLVTHLFSTLKPRAALAALPALLAGYFLITTVFFIFLGWIWPLFVPMTAVVLCYGIVLFLQYTEVQFQKELVLRELKMAASIQEQFLPQSVPQYEGLHTAFQTIFTKQVGGDLYDWVDLGEGRFGFCVGDVSGKGMPAAIYMAKALGDFRSISKRSLQPGEVCEALNQILVSRPTAGMFLTFVYGILDFQKKKFSYASAGHEPALFFQKKTKKAVILKEPQGMALGMFETTYDSSEISIEAGDSVLFYSDGVKELRNPAKQELGTEALRKIFEEEAVKNLKPEEMIQQLFKRFSVHQSGTPAHDDQTLLWIYAGDKLEG